MWVGGKRKRELFLKKKKKRKNIETRALNGAERRKKRFREKRLLEQNLARGDVPLNNIAVALKEGRGGEKRAYFVKSWRKTVCRTPPFL